MGSCFALLEARVEMLEEEINHLGEKAGAIIQRLDPHNGDPYVEFIGQVDNRFVLLFQTDGCAHIDIIEIVLSFLEILDAVLAFVVFGTELPLLSPVVPNPCALIYLGIPLP